MENNEDIRNTISRLQHPIDNAASLLSLLTSPLDALGLLPPQFRKHNTSPLSSPDSVHVRKHFPQIQRALLEHILPTWDTALKEEKPDATYLVKQYFCPDAFVNALPVSGEVALVAYETILGTRLNQYAIDLLESLSREYPIDRLWTAVFKSSSPITGRDKGKDGAMKSVLWEDCVRNIVSVPAKVANAVGMSGGRMTVPSSLENGVYFNNISKRCEVLLETISTKSTTGDWTPFNDLITKLVNSGVFPSSPPTSRSQPSFWKTNLPTIRQKLQFQSSPESESYAQTWQKLIRSIPSTLTLRSVLTSLFASLTPTQPSTDPSPANRAHVKVEAQLIHGILGNLTEDDDQLWDIATSLMFSREWEESYARIFVCWIAGAYSSNHLNIKALRPFLELIMDTWTSSEHIKHSLLSRHRYLTSLFLLAASYFPSQSGDLEKIVFSPSFMQGIGTYISHLDNSVRRCGMLAAEVIAELTNKKLAFGDWEGEDSGKAWCRQLRESIKARDIDTDLNILEEQNEELKTQPEKSSPSKPTPLSTESKPRPSKSKPNFITPEAGYDSDDSITGYAPSPSSSRSPSPTPSELEEIEKDPTINVGVKKVSRPVYLAQLGELVRGTGTKSSSPDEPHEADKIAMALNYGEELIRKKAEYGTELEENAVNLVYGFLALHDNFDLPDFDNKRQGILNALVACVPKKAAPALIEEFFKNQYSVDQRYVASNALAIGARELASLPILPSSVPKEKTAFPSKMLPGPLHRKYLMASQTNRRVLPLMVEDLSKKAIDKAKESAEDKLPTPIIRERRFKINKPPAITEIKPSTITNTTPLQSYLTPPPKPSLTFTTFAADTFIGPLLSHFWQHLRDSQTRESRTASRSGRGRYLGAGTGLVLSSLVLSQFLHTLAVLVDAGRNAPEWLAILAPGCLEVAVTVGTRRISDVEMTMEDEENGAHGEGGKEAAVLAAAFELALIILDGSMELDGGRTLGLDYTSLLLGTGEWAGAVFAKLEKGLRLEGGGGANEVKLQRAVTGVLLKVDELNSRWRRSMIDTR